MEKISQSFEEEFVSLLDGIASDETVQSCKDYMETLMKAETEMDENEANVMILLLKRYALQKCDVLDRFFREKGRRRELWKKSTLASRNFSLKRTLEERLKDLIDVDTLPEENVTSLLELGVDEIKEKWKVSEEDATKVLLVFLEEGADKTAQIMKAASKNKMELVDILVDKGCELRQGLGAAAYHGHKELVWRLLEGKGKDDPENINDAVHSSASGGQFELMEELLLKGAELDKAMVGAAIGGYREAVDKMLEKDESLMMKAIGGAAKGGHKDLVEDLMDRGGDINKAVDCAAQGGHLEMVNDYLARGAGINWATFGASEGGYKELLFKLIKKYYVQKDRQFQLACYATLQFDQRTLCFEVLKEFQGIELKPEIMRDLQEDDLREMKKGVDHFRKFMTCECASNIDDFEELEVSDIVLLKAASKNPSKFIRELLFEANKTKLSSELILLATTCQTPEVVKELVQNATKQKIKISSDECVKPLKQLGLEAEAEAINKLRTEQKEGSFLNAPPQKKSPKKGNKAKTNKKSTKKKK